MKRPLGIPQKASMKRLIALVAVEIHVDREGVEKVVDQFLAVLRDEVWAHRRILLPRFGAFRIVRRKAHAVLLPRNQSLACIVPEQDQVAFRATRNWRSH